jgi:hypothetical protein
MAARSAAKRSMPAAPAKPLWLVYLLGWLVPGGAHLWLGRTTKGLVFLAGLPAMFVIGLALEGRLFPFAPSEPLVALASVADLASGLPFLIAHTLGYGVGRPVALTYDYGNAFLITTGLLNALIVLDAHDIALGRK